MAASTVAAQLYEYLQRDDATRFLGIVGVSVGLLVWFYYQFIAGPNLKGIPRSGKEPGWFGMTEAKRDFAKNGPKIIEDGYRKYRNGLFKVQTLNVERVVLSPHYIEEINKTVPEDALSMADGLGERLLSQHTNLDIVFQSQLHIDVCKAQLTQNLHSLISPVNDEADYWLRKRIPGKVEIKVYDMIVRIISATASRMLGGPDVCRDPEWLETAALYSMDVVRVAMQLRPYPAFMRHFIAPWLDGTKTLDKHLRTAKKTFGPMFRERLAQADAGIVKSKEDKPIDMVQWMAESARGSDKDADVLAHNMLFMALAGVHTSSATTIHALFDLCAHPEHMEPLRNEIRDVVNEYGFTLSAINRMKKLDSFMKESQRLNQAVLMTFNRKVVKDVNLRDGTKLPSGSWLTMPSASVSRDPEIYPNPETFDGLRFYDKRMSSKSDANRHQFATTGPESLVFGQGKQACPGRFFAAAQIKAVIANILLNYEICFPEGQTERPKNLHKGGLVRPDPSQKIVFNPRKDTGVKI